QCRRVHALAHFRVAVQNLETATFLDTDLYVSALDRPVAETSALDAAADPFVLRGLVRALDGLERLANAANALAHDLAGAERVAGIENVSIADVPSVHADPLGEDIHHAFHRELRLVAAEAAHRARVRIVRVHRLGVDVDVGN